MNKNASELGKLASQKMTKEQKINRAQMGGKARWAKIQSKEERSEIMRKVRNKYKLNNNLKENDYKTQTIECK